MFFRIAFILFSLLLSGLLQTFGAEKWTLKDCITYAIKNNPTLHNDRLNEKIAEMNFRESKWDLLPGVGGGADAGYNFGRSVDPNTNGIINTSFFNNSYYLSASVNLFRGFMQQNQIQYQKYRKEAATGLSENDRDDLAFQVMTAYYYVVYYQEMVKIAEQQKSISGMNLKKTEVLVTTGLKAPADLLEVKANYEKEELFCIQTSNALETNWIALRKAMNLPVSQEILLDETQDSEQVVATLLPTVPELFERFSTWSPTLKSLESDWKASRKNVQVQRGGFFPSIQLQASYNTGFYETNRDNNDQIISFNDQIHNNRRQFLGASLTIPIFSRNAVRFGVGRSKMAAEQAQTRYEMGKQTLLYQVEGNYNDLVASRKELEQMQKQIQADTLSYQAAQKKYDQGMINVVELYTSKNRLANTAGQLLRTRLTCILKQKIIDFYQGRRFWE
ncbi:MAG: TolC family protein [Marinilabiliales bacterium]|nr:TolC family protein [Marinilabiliales bacterium]